MMTVCDPGSNRFCATHTTSLVQYLAPLKATSIMSETASIPVEDVTHVEVDAYVRYWEDGIVNGERDTDGSRIPLKSGDAWCAAIRLEDGVVEQWPRGVTAKLCYKVCDEGLYWLLNAQMQRLAQWKGSYVPASIFDQERGVSEGTEVSDYIVLRIDGQGRIQDWRVPRISLERWLPLTVISQGAPS